MKIWPFERKKQPAPEALPHTPLLPYDVRFKFNHGGTSLLSKTELLQLVLDGEREVYAFANNALHLILKAESSDPSRLLDLLTEIVKDLSEAETSEVAEQKVRDFAEKLFRQLSEDQVVDAHKLKTIYRQGIENWNSLYREAAERLSSEESDVYMVGTSTFFGLSAFVREFNKKGKTLYLLMPAYFPKPEEVNGNKGNYPCGFIFEPGGIVKELPRSFVRKEGSIIVDDFRNTGKTEDTIKEFWGTPNPIFSPIRASNGHV